MTKPLIHISFRNNSKIYELNVKILNNILSVFIPGIPGYFGVWVIIVISLIIPLIFNYKKIQLKK